MGNFPTPSRDPTPIRSALLVPSVKLMTTPRAFPRTTAILLMLAAGALSACSPPAAGSSAPTLVTATPGSAVDAHMVDVGSHSLYLSCTGAGAPTVVFVHGWVNDEGFVPHESAAPVSQLLADDFRVCLYDRRNVGGSEIVDAVQSPEDMRHDMEAVLASGGVEPPYILMAGSFGGLLAYDFLNHNPDDVAGLVFLDTMIPDELALDQYLASDDTFLHYREDDMCCTLERISQYDLINGLQQYIGHEPDVPMIYLASKQEPRIEYEWTTPAYDERYPGVLQAFVNRFTPGELRWVDAPHYMDPVVPDQIAQAVRDVDELASAH